MEIETHIPTKMSKSKQTYPWITPEIKKLQRKRDRYYVKAIKSKSPDHWRSFQQIRKQCKDQITNSHKAHLQTLFGDSLKDSADEIAPMYTHLFTQSYKLGQLPTSWKSAPICPLFKKGKRSLPENYRPVSLTAIPCKIFEHILVSQIWNHLNRYDIITSKQHGFRKGICHAKPN